MCLRTFEFPFHYGSGTVINYYYGSGSAKAKSYGSSWGSSYDFATMTAKVTQQHSTIRHLVKKTKRYWWTRTNSYCTQVKHNLKNDRVNLFTWKIRKNGRIKHVKIFEGKKCSGYGAVTFFASWIRICNNLYGSGIYKRKNRKRHGFYSIMIFTWTSCSPHMVICRNRSVTSVLWIRRFY